jgi:hypothetical protein
MTISEQGSIVSLMIQSNIDVVSGGIVTMAHY